jgi:hypothetical protein
MGGSLNFKFSRGWFLKVLWGCVCNFPRDITSLKSCLRSVLFRFLTVGGCFNTWFIYIFSKNKHCTKIKTAQATQHLAKERAQTSTNQLLVRQILIFLFQKLTFITELQSLTNCKRVRLLPFSPFWTGTLFAADIAYSAYWSNLDLSTFMCQTLSFA